MIKLGIVFFDSRDGKRLKVTVAEMVRFMKCFIHSLLFVATVQLDGTCDWLWPMKYESSLFPGWGSKEPCTILLSVSSFFIPYWAATMWWHSWQSGCLSYCMEQTPLLTYTGHMLRMRRRLLFCRTTENLGMVIIEAEFSICWTLQWAREWQRWEKNSGFQ